MLQGEDLVSGIQSVLAIIFLFSGRNLTQLKLGLQYHHSIKLLQSLWYLEVVHILVASDHQERDSNNKKKPSPILKKKLKKIDTGAILDDISTL